MLLTVALQATAAPSPPGEVSAKSAAQTKLVEGVELLKRQRYDEALERFREAYALVPSPLISYDFGLAYLGLGERAQALASFEAFLGGAPGAPADKRRKAQSYRDELRASVAVVELGADVPAADVSVDGQSLGRVSFPHRLYLEPGPHEVVARVDAAAGTQAATVTCGAGQTVGLSIRLLVPRPSAPPTLGATVTAGGGPASLPALRPTSGPAASSLIRAKATARPDSARRTRTWAMSAAGVGVLALGTGLTFGVLAKNEGDAVTDDSRNYRAFMPNAEAAGLRDQRWEAVFLSLGAVAIAAGVGLYALARHHDGGGSPGDGPP